MGVHLPEVFRPHQLSFKVETMKPPRSKECVDALTIRHWRLRCQTPADVPAFVREYLGHGRAPLLFAVGPTQANDCEFVVMRDRGIVVRSFCLIVNRRLGIADGNGSGDKNALPPDDWSRVAFAGQGDFPCDIFVFRPLDRWLGRVGDPLPRGPAPLWPLIHCHIVRKNANLQRHRHGHRHRHCDQSQRDRRHCSQSIGHRVDNLSGSQRLIH